MDCCVWRKRLAKTLKPKLFQEASNLTTNGLDGGRQSELIEIPKPVSVLLQTVRMIMLQRLDRRQAGRALPSRLLVFFKVFPGRG